MKSKSRLIIHALDFYRPTVRSKPHHRRFLAVGASILAAALLLQPAPSRAAHLPNGTDMNGTDMNGTDMNGAFIAHSGAEERAQCGAIHDSGRVAAHSNTSARFRYLASASTSWCTEVSQSASVHSRKPENGFACAKSMGSRLTSRLVRRVRKKLPLRSVISAGCKIERVISRAFPTRSSSPLGLREPVCEPTSSKPVAPHRLP